MDEAWKKKFADKIVGAQDALQRIGSGTRIFVGSACAEPQELMRALSVVGANLADTEIMHVLTLGVAAYAQPAFADRFRANAFFIGNSLRDAVGECRADYTPVFLSRVPQLFRSRRVPVDVSLICVSTPDEHGYCSYGVSVDITKAATESAKLVIAQVNRFMPRTQGDCFIHVNDIDYLVPYDEPLLEWPFVRETDDVIARIGANVARLIEDGSTLQMGIGRIPNAILSCLGHKRDLGIHTEMFSDGILELVDAGVVNGRKKQLHTGKIVGSFAAGSRKLFDFLNNNPAVEMHPSEYTNDVFVIAQHEKMVAINSALEVDLTGQVCADSLGETFFSGLGGHADFTRGAALARNGKSIIAMPSTAQEGDKTISRISPYLRQGAGVITTRGDIQYVVTEYGIAYLHGKNMRERAMALISIAHPDFRSELLHAAKKRKMVYMNQIMPAPGTSYPEHLESTVDLRDGARVFVRPMKPTDESSVKDMFYRFSEQTRYLRYHAVIKSMPHNRLQVFCNVDYETEMALVGFVEEDNRESAIAVARYLTDPSGKSAEVAFVIRDDWQFRGLGKYLFDRLVEIARSQGIQRFSAEVLSENKAMLHIFEQAGLPIKSQADEGVVHVDIDLGDVK